MREGLDEIVDSLLETTIRKPSIEQIDGVIYADGWEDCLVGHGNLFHGSDGQKVVAIYDRTKMVERLSEDFRQTCEANNGQDHQEDCDHVGEADEYISFNVEGAFYKVGMPVYASFQASTINVEEM